MNGKKAKKLNMLAFKLAHSKEMQERWGTTSLAFLRRRILKMLKRQHRAGILKV